jgi:hypothetical protein
MKPGSDSALGCELREVKSRRNIGIYYNLMSSQLETLRLEDIESLKQLIENGVPVDSQNIRRVRSALLTKCDS